MGLYDTLELPAALSLPNCDRDPATIEWQTKSIDRPRMGTYRLIVDGVLLEEEWHSESVPEEERPYYGTDEWDQSPILRMAGYAGTAYSETTRVSRVKFDEPGITETYTPQRLKNSLEPPWADDLRWK